MKRKIYLSLAIVLLIFLTACTSNPPATTTTAASSETQATSETETNTEASEATSETTVTITHDLGETSVNLNPDNVIVFDYGLLDALNTAGVDQIVGVPKSNTLPAHLSLYEDDAYTNVGSLAEADFEAIYERQPELILITNRMQNSYDQLSEIAPTVYLSMPMATYADTFSDNMTVLSEIFTDQADAFTGAIDTVSARIAEIQPLASGHTGLIIQANDGELTVFGFGSRYALLYDDLGFTLTDETIEESTHGQAASFEYVASQNPEYLFVIDRSAAIGSGTTTGAEQLLANELIAGMDAAQNDKVIYLNSSNWYTVSGGIQSTLSMLEEIEAALSE